MLRVNKVDANNGFTIFAELSVGRTRIIDVKHYLDKGVFIQLKDMDYFKKIELFLCVIVWQNEQDLSSDSIAHILK